MDVRFQENKRKHCNLITILNNAIITRTSWLEDKNLTIKNITKNIRTNPIKKITSLTIKWVEVKIKIESSLNREYRKFIKN